MNEIDKKVLRGLSSKYLEDNDVAKDKMMAGIKDFMLKKIEIF